MENNLYYTAPSDESFEDMKQAAIEVWKTYSDEFGYASSKIDRIKDIKNIRANFMYIFAMFDMNNQRKVASKLSAKTTYDLYERLIAGGNSEDFINAIDIEMKLGHYILTKDKKIKDVPLLKWGKWMQGRNRLLKQTMVNNHLVSTIFLGLDHNFGLSRKKILFETMVFYKGKGTSRLNDEQERYSTYKEAIKGHNKLVKLIKKPTWIN